MTKHITSSDFAEMTGPIENWLETENQYTDVTVNNGRPAKRRRREKMMPLPGLGCEVRATEDYRKSLLLRWSPIPVEATVQVDYLAGGPDGGPFYVSVHWDEDDVYLKSSKTIPPDEPFKPEEILPEHAQELYENVFIPLQAVVRRLHQRES